MPTEYEIIPIPEDKARNKQPMRLRVAGLDALPDSEFEIRFDWNSFMEKWIVEFIHLETDKRIAKRPAMPVFEYNLGTLMTFIFFDPSGEEKEVTPQNLGDEMLLTAWPKEDGGTLPDGTNPYSDS